jgi:Uma2 family endonuclease
MSEVIEHALDAKALSQRWREILADPRLTDFVGKIDLDCWGRIIMSPVNTDHGAIAANLAILLKAQLGGRTLVEVGVQTTSAIYAPDVAWCTDDFLASHRNETPLARAPDICVEIASPSNAIHDLRAKARAYIEAGATEAWVVFPKSKRIEFHGKQGTLQQTQFEVDLTNAFV